MRQMFLRLLLIEGLALVGSPAAVLGQQSSNIPISEQLDVLVQANPPCRRPAKQRINIVANHIGERGGNRYEHGPERCSLVGVRLPEQ